MKHRMALGVVLALAAVIAGAKEGEGGGGPKPTVKRGSVVRVDGNTLVISGGKEGRTQEVSIQTSGGTEVVIVESYREVEGVGEGGQKTMRREPVTRAGALGDLTAGMRVEVTIVNDTATKVTVVPKDAPKASKEGGGEGDGPKPPKVRREGGGEGEGAKPPKVRREGGEGGGEGDGAKPPKVKREGGGEG